MNDDVFTYARTGYTGEDGLEIMVDLTNLNLLIEFLNKHEIAPCGLGARDTLRLEASLPLYGFELSEEISPVEANLKWTITNKNIYMGSESINRQSVSYTHLTLPTILRV